MCGDFPTTSSKRGAGHNLFFLRVPFVSFSFSPRPRLWPCVSLRSAIVAKEPRIMSLDTGSTVPRKLEGLAHAFAVHAEANDEEAAEMITQVLCSYIHARVCSVGLFRS